MFSGKNQNNGAVVYKFSVQTNHICEGSSIYNAVLFIQKKKKKSVQNVTERKKYKVVMCHVKGQSSGLETFRAPFCQTRSSRTG